jgi:hypothetical protein
VQERVSREKKPRGETLDTGVRILSC